MKIEAWGRWNVLLGPCVKTNNFVFMYVQGNVCENVYISYCHCSVENLIAKNIILVIKCIFYYMEIVGVRE